MIGRPIDLALEPEEALAALDPEPGPFLLETGFTSRAAAGRWSFAGAFPAEVVEGGAADGPDPLAAVEAALSRRRGGRPAEEIRRARVALPMPFAGGAVGFLGYDYGRRLERLPSLARADQRFPDVRFGIYPHVLAFDHEGRKWWIAGEREGFEAALARYSHVLGGGRRARAFETAPPPSPLPPAPPEGRPLGRTFDRDSYCRAVARAIEFILDGDIFEVNLAQRFETAVEAAPLHLYGRLCAEAAAPFAAYLRFGPLAVLSASPERFLAVRDRRVETEPIKGTRPRGASAAEDERLARELSRSAKDRAELAMIVDLARNDLGRVASPGSVRVRRAAELRTFPAVHHLAGAVEAELAPGKTAFDAIRAAFPGGSITGAPKVRAMEIIEALEPTRRSVYTGAMGYVGLDGDADLNIAIRTVLLDGRRATFQAGGAVTAESDPAAEYEETLAKGRALARALGVTIDEGRAAPHPFAEGAHGPAPTA